MGFAMMGTASASGPNAAREAAQAAIQCPLLEEGGLRGARAVLLNISASGNLSLHEMFDACRLIKEATGNEDVQINFGLVPDESLGDEVKITVIATGFERVREAEAARTVGAHTDAVAARPGARSEAQPEAVASVDMNMLARADEASRLEVPAYLRRKAE
jgi:cell division protein FtsZ